LIDIYCERLGSGLLSEPVNAISNISFLLAAWFAWVLVCKTSAPKKEIYILIFLIALIGVGSALFHTFATNWSKILDIVPIFLFQICLLWIYARHIVNISFLISVISISIFIGANVIALQFPSVLNGSLMYLPAILALLFLGVFHFFSQKNGRWLLLSAAAIFCVSLSFRTIDAEICSIFPLGTHFIWHIINGIVLYLATRAIITARYSRVASQMNYVNNKN